METMVMTITIPPEVEKSILAAVRSGRFASVDEAMAEGARLLIRELSREQPAPLPAHAGDETPDPMLGLMRDDAELMDEIVADAYRQRREDNWREVDL
jgi:Arc/MetJ-type ribon-helix-helix transcriptional regulator